MAAAEATSRAAESAAAAAASTSRFAAACGALSQYVRAAERARSRPSPAPAPAPARPLPLMPGAHVDDDGCAEPEAAPAPQQLTIVYGGRALVLDDVPADKVASLLRLAAAAARGAETASGAGQASAAADLPVARKASLQRFMEKRKGRVAARGEPYHRPAAARRDHLTLAL